jgi:hypothetical protein
MISDIELNPPSNLKILRSVIQFLVPCEFMYLAIVCSETAPAVEAK